MLPAQSLRGQLFLIAKTPLFKAYIGVYRYFICCFRLKETLSRRLFFRLIIVAVTEEGAEIYLLLATFCAAACRSCTAVSAPFSPCVSVASVPVMPPIASPVTAETHSPVAGTGVVWNNDDISDGLPALGCRLNLRAVRKRRVDNARSEERRVGKECL